MGAHFDFLCDVVGGRAATQLLDLSGKSTSFAPNIKCEEIPDLQAECARLGAAIDLVGDPMDFLKRVVRETALFELPIESDRTQELIGKSTEKVDADGESEFSRYINDYFDISAAHGRHLIRPFRVTGIEDRHSFACLVPVSSDRDSHYITIVAVSGKDRPPNRRIAPASITDFNDVLICSVNILGRKNNTQSMFAMPLFFLLNSESGGVYAGSDNDLWEGLQRDAITNTNAFLEELTYITDPDSFIIREESENSRRIGRKLREGGRHPQARKTALRPHYICRSQEDTAAMFSDHSKVKYPAHPVRGHWRTLMSAKYVNKRFQRVFVEQYWTGDGIITAEGGITYQVYVKHSPIALIPYGKVKE